MNITDRINEALRLAKQGDFHSAHNILILTNTRTSDDERALNRAWSKFGKMWRAA